MSKSIAKFLVVAGAWAISASSAYAVSLPGISPSGEPNFFHNVKITIRNDAIKVRKNNGSSDFVLNTSSGAIAGTHLMYALDGSFDSGGNFLGGTVSLSGRLPSIGITSNTDLFSALLPAGNANVNWAPNLIGFNTSNIVCDPLLVAAIGSCTTNESVYLLLDTTFDGNFNATGGNAFKTTGKAVTTIPLPAAVWLFGSGLVGLIGVATRRRNAQAVT